MGLHTGTPLVTAEGYVGGTCIGPRGSRPPGTAADPRLAVHGRAGRRRTAARSGLHRLKDLGAAERVYQLGDEDFAALRSLYRTNLPVPATPFLGRERELAEVVSLAAATRCGS